MNLLINEEELETAKRADLLPVCCERCNNTFYRSKSMVLQVLKHSKRNKLKYCSKICKNEAKIINGPKYAPCECKRCEKVFLKERGQIKQSPNHFCSHSCAAKYNNTKRLQGKMRSKLELWIEKQLGQLYPDLEVHYCRRDAIDGELDIYIPSLKLAFEINGIFHYEAIFGEEHLCKMQTNDSRKFQACIEKGISLCVIDSSKCTYIKPEKVKKYLDIITNIIDAKKI